MTGPASRRRSPPLHTFGHGLYWCTFAAALLLASLLLSWQALAAVDFGYPVWHDTLGIDATIERYGPRNRYREGFERTTAEERARLFGAIVDAIHARGEGLAELRYRDADGRVLARLLRPPEIVHLQDVARLVGAFRVAGLVGLAALVLLVAIARWRRYPPPPLRRFVLGGVVAAVVIAVVLAALGPVEVFYALHEWIFPPDHPWFFWYEDSLMSTMMQAPNLFGAIAIVWALLAAAVAGGALAGLCRWLERAAGQAPR